MANLNVIPGNHSLFKVNSPKGEEILKIDNNGDFFVRGKLIENDKEIVEAFRDFLKSTGVFKESRIGAKTFLGEDIHPDTLGIVYLCKYDFNAPSIKVTRELQFKTPFEALEAYANIPNPESQMASGKTQEEMLKQLDSLHKNLNDPEWVAKLAEYL